MHGLWDCVTAILRSNRDEVSENFPHDHFVLRLGNRSILEIHLIGALADLSHTCRCFTGVHISGWVVVEVATVHQV